ncbi:hypothetical protein CWATWH0402_5213 [Crocosphaera watsonii WH 0402]|uniref:Uncharacterized protein n=2 Tax=Crocosphaera watsonii TaxID=263511 RepID=T2JTL0_CROWT|nr:hypothetical protein CWATWH0005_170 [Crocosphaera watsonii WH 0005]CCQ69183.1 hypothetical protein CWATWH0402_5213 [Crocosphaera watsonii WH 0402]
MIFVRQWTSQWGLLKNSVIQITALDQKVSFSRVTKELGETSD